MEIARYAYRKAENKQLPQKAWEWFFVFDREIAQAISEQGLSCEVYIDRAAWKDSRENIWQAIREVRGYGYSVSLNYQYDGIMIINVNWDFSEEERR